MHTLGRRPTVSHHAPRLAKRKFHKLFSRSRKRIIRFSLLTANLAMLGAVVFFVANTPNKDQTAQYNTATAVAASGVASGPLDKVSSADIAVHLAYATGLPEATSVANRADSLNSIDDKAAANNSVVAKPQVVSTALPSRKDIHTYVVKQDETLSTIATKFGVSSDSIKWSNGLTGNEVAVGKALKMPPNGTNGIVYTVAAGDTAESLAQKYSADKNLLISFNDAEVSGLKVGEQILIPNGVIQAPVVTRSYNYYSSSGAGFAWGGSSAIYGRNGYDYGYCTWYVANRISVPANWGNADTWPRGARASGWTVSSVPKKGSIAQGAPIAMHVAYVEEVSEDGKMIKYSDMNNLAGWGKVGYSGWVPASYFPRYIYP